MRSSEMALRKVNGASNTSLSVQFAIELLLILCIALLCGLLMIEVSMSSFLNFTQIEASVYYGEIIAYHFDCNYSVFPVCTDTFILIFAVGHCRKR